MPTETVSLPGKRPMHPRAARRILRLALGSSLSLLASQLMAMPLSFMMPILTLLILATPLPKLSVKQGIVFLLALLLPMLGGVILLPFLHGARWAGIGLLTLCLFYSFYYTSRGGKPILGTFMTIGLTLVVTIGSVSIELMIVLIQSLAVYGFLGIAFVWLAHALLPDLPQTTGAPAPRPPVQEIDLRESRRNALRSLAMVLPIALAFLFSSASPAYTVVMIKVAAMGQQATVDDSKALGVELLQSTFWGGVLAIVVWNLLSIWPSLLFYTLLVALVCLVAGRWIFQGPALHPQASMVSYALVTFLIVLAPAVLDSPISSDASSAFYGRLGLLVGVAVYGTLAARIFDAFWPGKAVRGVPAGQEAAVT